MKKLLMGATLLASASFANTGEFDNFYLGANVDYNFGEVEYSASDKNQNALIKKFLGDVKGDTTGFEASFFVGRGFQANDIYWGFEAFAGTGFQTNDKTIKDKNYPGASLKIETKRELKIGFGGRFGKVIDNDILIYGRLNFNATHLKTKGTLSGSLNRFAPITDGSKDLNFFLFSAAPGIGVEWAFNKGLHARLEYTREFSLNKKSSDIMMGGIEAEVDSSNIVSLGVSFAL